MTKQEIIGVLKHYERTRNEVTAVHPTRYHDVAEYLLILFKSQSGSNLVELTNQYLEDGDDHNEKSTEGRYSKVYVLKEELEKIQKK